MAPWIGRPLKANVDEACESLPGVESVVMLRRCGNDVAMNTPRQGWATLDEAANDAAPAADGFRSPALPALHLGFDRQAQGHRAHHRRHMVYTAHTLKTPST